MAFFVCPSDIAMSQNWSFAIYVLRLLISIILIVKKLIYAFLPLLLASCASKNVAKSSSSEKISYELSEESSFSSLSSGTVSSDRSNLSHGSSSVVLSSLGPSSSDEKDAPGGIMIFKATSLPLTPICKKKEIDISGHTFFYYNVYNDGEGNFVLKDDFSYIKN